MVILCSDASLVMQGASALVRSFREHVGSAPSLTLPGPSRIGPGGGLGEGGQERRAEPAAKGIDRSSRKNHDGHVKATGIAELKARLSRYLDQVKSGQEVVITERGRPVAKLVPLRSTERGESRRERLARAGLLHLGSGRIRAALLKPPKGPSIGKSVLKELLAERDEGR